MRRFLRRFIVALAAVCGISVAALYGGYRYMVADLPDVAAVKACVAGRFAGEASPSPLCARIAPGAFTPFDTMPGHLVAAFLQHDDGLFFEGEAWGVFSRARRLVSILSGATERYCGGMITAHTTRRVVAGTAAERRPFQRVVYEGALEEGMTKKEMFTLYCNTLYFGRGSHGLEDAARAYFGKDATDLDLAESALLPVLAQRPTAANSTEGMEWLQARRNTLLRQMEQRRAISPEECNAAVARPLGIVVR